jgi:hypothetical protein
VKNTASHQFIPEALSHEEEASPAKLREKVIALVEDVRDVKI